jgi:hypothetical protein
MDVHKALTELNMEYFKNVLYSLAMIPVLLYIGWVMKNNFVEFVRKKKGGEL